MGNGEVIRGVFDAGGQRLDKALADLTDLSRERIKALMAEGRVQVAGRVATSGSAKTAPGATFEIAVPATTPLDTAAQDIPLDVVFEDAHLIVIDKPAGMVVHPAAGNEDGTLVNALLHHCAGQLSGIGGVARPGIVHRIDKDTSGLIVVAKSDIAHEGLARQFAEHSLDRVYKAVVKGSPAPPSGAVDARIGRSDKDRKKMAVLDPMSPRGKHAVTHYRTLQPLAHSTLIECRLETGRTHQIRVHMASIGHPLVGDPVYGKPDSRLRPHLQRLSFARQALHAAVLGFQHPVSGDRLLFSSDLPPDMRELIETLNDLD